MRPALPLLASLALLASATTNPDRPNFILLLTDDQDADLNSLDFMPETVRFFADHGITLPRHYCTVSKCCPSRVSMLTGKAAHNTNVTDVKAPYGGYAKFVEEGWNDKYLPVYLQEAGWNTFYVGKLMNGHSTQTWDSPRPAGWNGTNYLIDPGTYYYYNACTQANDDPPQWNPGRYSTDIVSNSSFELLDKAAADSERPFFIGIAPIAPHSETNDDAPPGTMFDIPLGAKRHEHLFNDERIPRNPNFNPDTPSGASWIKGLHKLSDAAIEYADGFHRERLRSLQAVEDIVVRLEAWLDAHPEIAENTYIFFSTDNGFHLGQHRLGPGKVCGIEEDIHIPFLARGPGIEPRSILQDSVTTHTDFLPSIFALAGLDVEERNFDGAPIPFNAKLAEKYPLAARGGAEHAQAEYWGEGLFEGIFGNQSFVGNNTYKTLRVIGGYDAQGRPLYDLAYTVWCTNERELYDMQVDRWQMNNLAEGASYDDSLSSASSAIVAGSWPLTQVLPRLDALLLALKACNGTRECKKPWRTLHPQGGVDSLKEAMSADFDAWYAEGDFGRVAYQGCKPGYITDVEVPLQVQALGPVKRSVVENREL